MGWAGCGRDGVSKQNVFIRPRGKLLQASGFISPDGYASRKGLWLPWALASSSPGGFFGYSMPPPMRRGGHMCRPRRTFVIVKGPTRPTQR